MSGCLYLPGTASNHPSSPSSSALQALTGDFELQAEFEVLSFPITNAPIVARFSNDGGATPLHFVWWVVNDGSLRLRVSPDGTAVNAIDFSSNTGLFTINERSWYSVTYDVDNGSALSEASYYKSSDGVTWGAPIATITGTKTVPYGAGTSRLGLLGEDTTFGYCEGNLSGVRVYNGIGGAAAFNADFTKLTTAEIAAKAFTEDSSNAATVTLNGTAWRYIWKGGSDGGPRRVASTGQMLRTGRAQN